MVPSTAWVADPDGAPYGVQITFFRNRPRVAEDNASHFAPRQLLFAHAALADPRRGRLRYDQRAAREGFGLAGAAEESTDVWIDDWSLKRAQGSYRAQIAARDFAFDLRFTSDASAVARRRCGFLAQGSGPAPVERLLQRAAARRQRPDRCRRGARPITGSGMARSRMVERGTSAVQAAGWDWAGINLARRRRT